MILILDSESIRGERRRHYRHPHGERLQQFHPHAASGSNGSHKERSFLITGSYVLDITDHFDLVCLRQSMTIQHDRIGPDHTKFHVRNHSVNARQNLPGKVMDCLSIGGVAVVADEKEAPRR